MPPVVLVSLGLNRFHRTFFLQQWSRFLLLVTLLLIQQTVNTFRVAGSTKHHELNFRTSSSVAHSIIPLSLSKTNAPFHAQVAFLEQNHHQTLLNNVRHVVFPGTSNEERFSMLSTPESYYDEEAESQTFSNEADVNASLGSAISAAPDYVVPVAVSKNAPFATANTRRIRRHTRQLPPIIGREYVSAIPIADMPRSHFVGPVSFGNPPQTFWLIFDTGSTNIQVVGKRCSVSSCLRVRRYEASKSKTYAPMTPRVHLDVTFGTGYVRSTLGMDEVRLGSYAVPNQTFAIIDYEADRRPNAKSIFDDIDFQGLLGLGFPSLAAAGRTPIFDNILRLPGHQNFLPEFAFYMSDPRRALKVNNSSEVFPSALFIGGVDPQFFIPPIQEVPVVREHYWEVELDELWVGDTKFCCRDDEDKTPGYVIFDSGTSFNTIPHREAKRFFNLFLKKQCLLEPLDTSGDTEESIRETLLKDYPTITYKLVGGVNITLTPDMYLLSNSHHYCTPAYMQIDVPSQFGHAYILGAVAYMQHYFTVFRRSSSPNQPSTVGIARARHTPHGRIFLKTLGEKALAL